MLNTSFTSSGLPNNMEKENRTSVVNIHSKHIVLKALQDELREKPWRLDEKKSKNTSKCFFMGDPNEGNTPLMSAAKFGKFSVCEFLLSIGSNIEAKNEVFCYSHANNNHHWWCFTCIPIIMKSYDWFERSTFLRCRFSPFFLVFVWFVFHVIDFVSSYCMCFFFHVPHVEDCAYCHQRGDKITSQLFLRFIL